MILVNAMGWICMAATLLASLCYIYFHWFYPAIRVKTIKVQKSVPALQGAPARSAVNASRVEEALMTGEYLLRKRAYKHTPIQKGESFFDDSDMRSAYYLIVVYHKKDAVPLLTARYYDDKAMIAHYLANGDLPDSRLPGHHNENKLFLIDRMSANVHSAVYRRHRNYIQGLFYAEFLRRNPNRTCIAMARMGKHEKLLAKYVRLGFDIIGTTQHQGKPHWLLAGDLNKNHIALKRSAAFSLVVMARRIMYTLKRQDA